VQLERYQVLGEGRSFLHGVQGVASSNLVAPTNYFKIDDGTS